MDLNNPTLGKVLNKVERQNKEISDLQSELVALKAEREWQDIATVPDKIKEDNTRVLLDLDDDGVVFGWWSTEVYGGPSWFAGQYNDTWQDSPVLLDPKRWRSLLLPSPPETKEKVDK